MTGVAELLLYAPSTGLDPNIDSLLLAGSDKPPDPVVEPHVQFVVIARTCPCHWTGHSLGSELSEEATVLSYAAAWPAARANVRRSTKTKRSGSEVAPISPHQLISMHTSITSISQSFRILAREGATIRTFKKRWRDDQKNIVLQCAAPWIRLDSRVSSLFRGVDSRACSAFLTSLKLILVFTSQPGKSAKGAGRHVSSQRSPHFRIMQRRHAISSSLPAAAYGTYGMLGLPMSR